MGDARDFPHEGAAARGTHNGAISRSQLEGTSQESPRHPASPQPASCPVAAALCRSPGPVHVPRPAAQPPASLQVTAVLSISPLPQDNGPQGLLLAAQTPAEAQGLSSQCWGEGVPTSWGWVAATSVHKASILSLCYGLRLKQ